MSFPIQITFEYRQRTVLYPHPPSKLAFFTHSAFQLVLREQLPNFIRLQQHHLHLTSPHLQPSYIIRSPPPPFYCWHKPCPTHHLNLIEPVPPPVFGRRSNQMQKHNTKIRIQNVITPPRTVVWHWHCCCQNSLLFIIPCIASSFTKNMLFPNSYSHTSTCFTTSYHTPDQEDRPTPTFFTLRARRHRPNSPYKTTHTCINPN